MFVFLDEVFFYYLEWNGRNINKKVEGFNVE